MLEAAKKNPTTASIANDLETQLFKYWSLRIGDGPDHVFRALGLGLTREKPLTIFHWLSFDIIGDNVLASPEFKTFSKLLDRFNKENPDKKTTLVSVLKNVYGPMGPSKLILKALSSKEPSTENIAKRLEAELFKMWLTKYNPNQAFRFLKLHRSPDNVLDNPLLKIWASYMNTFNTKNPSKKTTMIDTFRTQFGDESLSKLLVEAKAVQSSKKMATDLQASLLTKWTAEKKTTASVAKLLGNSEDGQLMLKTYTVKLAEV
ncbi:Secreted RxLR effector peptide protein [Phytophthora palmivora]|uniref:Secreted RxLR effector peptide protein n=1 Tax=Phytophthora palmivora TaxID=4796 RepID=A0A2P4XKK4_9STRA|nr:Secreted RxLR effector peptide protein [Phytophthora palmivora]